MEKQYYGLSFSTGKVVLKRGKSVIYADKENVVQLLFEGWSFHNMWADFERE